MAKKISQAEYVKRVAAQTGMTTKQVKDIQEAERDVLAKSLKSHDAVRTNFGTIKKRIKPAVRKGTPVKGIGGVTIKSKGKPATTKVRLSASRDLLDSL